jgi:hypothetical protein
MTSAACVAATALLLAYPMASADAASAHRGPLVSARAALHHHWACDSIADAKFSCTRTRDADDAGFTVVLRPLRDLPKWQEDPELQPQVARVTRHWFLTVQPNPGLSDEDFAAVKRAISRCHR